MVFVIGSLSQIVAQLTIVNKGKPMLPWTDITGQLAAILSWFCFPILDSLFWFCLYLEMKNAREEDKNVKYWMPWWVNLPDKWPTRLVRLH
jgi:hypothetical protein